MLFVTMLKEQKKKLLSLYIFDTIADRFCAGTNKWLLFTHKNVDLAVISVTELGSVVDSGNGPGGAATPPLFLDQTEARRAEKSFFRPPPAYLRIWMTGPTRLTQGLDPALKLHRADLDECFM